MLGSMYLFLFADTKPVQCISKTKYVLKCFFFAH